MEEEVKEDKLENPLAFPTLAISPSGDRYGEDGMTLRDYFAGQAMQSLIASSVNKGYPGIVAVAAYDYADAMLRERGEDD